MGGRGGREGGRGGKRAIEKVFVGDLEELCVFFFFSVVGGEGGRGGRGRGRRGGGGRKRGGGRGRWAEIDVSCWREGKRMKKKNLCFGGVDFGSTDV